MAPDFLQAEALEHPHIHDLQPRQYDELQQARDATVDSVLLAAPPEPHPGTSAGRTSQRGWHHRPTSTATGMFHWFYKIQLRSAETQQPFDNALWAEKARVIIFCILLKVFSIIMVIKKQMDGGSNRV
jgi:hypothetical protein